MYFEDIYKTYLRDTESEYGVVGVAKVENLANRGTVA